jgi:DNA-binding LytR/AlgR family response regulator
VEFDIVSRVVFCRGGDQMATILIAENDKSICELILSNILSMEEDIKLFVRETAEAALCLSITSKIDYYILDNDLPDIKEIGLVEGIRKQSIRNPIIIISEYCFELFENETNNSFENVYYLEKPFRNADILFMVNYFFLNKFNYDQQKLTLIYKHSTKIYDIDKLLYIEKIDGEKFMNVVTFSRARGFESEKIRYISLVEITRLFEDRTLLIRCSQSYVVNPDKIKEINLSERTIKLTVNGIIIPLGRAYTESMKEILKERKYLFTRFRKGYPLF